MLWQGLALKVFIQSDTSTVYRCYGGSACMQPAFRPGLASARRRQELWLRQQHEACCCGWRAWGWADLMGSQHHPRRERRILNLRIMQVDKHLGAELLKQSLQPYMYMWLCRYKC